ncbi:GGDEF domain-containing protein [Rhodococcus sp. SRB_17]|nr:GGDEF domain-containing protein [Rhodococcus sp. SRB_17]
METFVWDQHFVTGLPDVDEQHRGLVDLFNELSRSLFVSEADTDPGAGREALLRGIFERLVAYTEYHFSEEEALMHSAGVDARHTEAHVALHRQFVQQVHTFWATRATMAAPAESIVHFLTAWLGLHILGIDQSLARQIAAIAQGLPAAQAYEREMSAHDNSTQVLLKMIGKLYQVLSAQNDELVQANQRLEDRVAQRTAELAQANVALQQANERLEAYARTDGLLQVANRSCFDDRLAQACASAFRRQVPLGLLMIDVDDFKRYNDQFGHPAGDACLQAVARAVQHAMQRSTDLVARYGGEELAVLLPDTDAAGAAAVAARVVAAVAALRLPHPASVAPHVSVSVGAVGRVPRLQDAGAQLVAEADSALYQAKAAGRNCWLLAPPY